MCSLRDIKTGGKLNGEFWRVFNIIGSILSMVPVLIEILGKMNHKQYY